MSANVRQGEPDRLDPDYGAVFMAVVVILNRLKGKKRREMIKALLDLSQPLAGVAPLEGKLRADACLNKAVRSICGMRGWEIPESALAD